jgi:hypothetical protein
LPEVHGKIIASWIARAEGLIPIVVMLRIEFCTVQVRKIHSRQRKSLRCWVSDMNRKKTEQAPAVVAKKGALGAYG